jgi:hypothetical protein
MRGEFIKRFGFVFDPIMLHEFLGSIGVFADDMLQRLKEFDGSERDIVQIADGGWDDGEHGEKI